MVDQWVLNRPNGPSLTSKGLSSGTLQKSKGHISYQFVYHPTCQDLKKEGEDEIKFVEPLYKIVQFGTFRLLRYLGVKCYRDKDRI
jgi:hypothetical protein